jgi:hypothetical protein
MRTSAKFHEAAIKPLPDFPEPTPVAALSPTARSHYARGVSSALAARLLPSQHHVELIEGLTDSYDASQGERAESRTMLAVDGPFGVGKTGAILDWALSLYRDAIASEDVVQAQGEVQPGRATPDGGRANDVPVIWVGLRGSQQTSGVYRKILAFVDHGTTNQRADQLEISVGEALEDHRPRLLVIDDAHMLNTRLIEGRKTLDSLKALNDMLSHVGGTLLFVGADLDGGDLLSDPQIAARLETPYLLRPYGAATKSEIAQWQRLIKACEPLVRPYLDPDDAHPLLPHARMLWNLSQGRVRDLSRLLTQGTRNAINAGHQRIVAEHFARVRILKHVEDRQRRTGQREGKQKRAS